MILLELKDLYLKLEPGKFLFTLKSLTLLAKSLRPIPIAKEIIDEDGNKTIFDQFADKELRYRQRYVDLIVNPEIKEVFVKSHQKLLIFREIS